MTTQRTNWSPRHPCLRKRRRHFRKGWAGYRRKDKGWPRQSDSGTAGTSVHRAGGPMFAGFPKMSGPLRRPNGNRHPRETAGQLAVGLFAPIAGHLAFPKEPSNWGIHAPHPSQTRTCMLTHPIPLKEGSLTWRRSTMLRDQLAANAVRKCPASDPRSQTHFSCGMAATGAGGA